MSVPTTQYEGGCQCQAWRPVVLPTSDAYSLLSLMDTCKSCQHTLDSHVRAVKDLPDELIDRILFLVYDMTFILRQIQNEKLDQDLKEVYNFLFQFLKKNILQPTPLSLAGEKLGVPPFEKPSIAKVHVHVHVIMHCTCTPENSYLEHTTSS